MNKLFLLIFLVAFNFTNSQTISFQEYFPLKKGVTRVFYVSHITGQENLEDDIDTSICKSMMVKGKEIFYFDDELKSDDAALISSNSFCGGVFYYDNAKFVFSPVSWQGDLKKANPDYFETLFPAGIALDTVYRYRDGDEKRGYTFNGFEDVLIKNRVIKDCLKLTVTADWPTAHYADTVWFKKGFGVVKWLRGTGRLEEIKL